MKKTITFLGLGILIMSATAAVNKNGYTVSGTVKGAQDGDTVILAELEYLNLIPLDTTTIKNGTFVFSGDQKEPAYRYVSHIKHGEVKSGNDLILENAHITVAIDENNKGAHGTPNNELWNKYQEENEKIGTKMEPYWKIAQDTTQAENIRAEAQKEIEKVEKEQSDYLLSFIRENITSGVGQLLLNSYYLAMDTKTLEEIIGDMEKMGVKNELYTTIKEKLGAIKRTTIGNQFTDIELNGPDGKPAKLSNYVSHNKITLVDFWASWCGPCLAEMPNVLKAYELYKDKGFGIVGVSLDNNSEAWKNAIQRLKLSWPQMSDLQGWQSKGAAAYDITSIPATILIDQKGEIVEKNLRGEDLLNKLEELLNTK